MVKITRRTRKIILYARKASVHEASSPDSSISPTESLDSIHSPFYLTSGENHGLAIISEVLDGMNYGNWRIAMTIALYVKNKLTFIDGFIARPSDWHRSFKIWSRCNSMVKSWLLNLVSKEIYKSILCFNDASEIRKDLLTKIIPIVSTNLVPSARNNEFGNLLYYTEDTLG